jgi:aspartyl-tRNA(Asn)/glutamyl-tRNA(Gln) amidotransferase subunit B
MVADLEAVIGLEVHCQLATKSKIFCACSTGVSGLAQESRSELRPNINICPICAGHPGTLPSLNQKVVEYAVMAGLATHCKIRLRSTFARKNYFYPDLPKGYQISQHDEPICEFGWIDLLPANSAAGQSKRIGIRRIHMEEDAGKSIHRLVSATGVIQSAASTGYSVVDLNRAGIPLIEIVSEPDLRSAEEAGTYLRALYSIVTSLGICEGNMQGGNFRCDANVSLRPCGSTIFGTRAEIKNVNSFRFVEKAIDYEIRRQTQLFFSGVPVIQETRSYDSDRDLTLSMRSKEDAEDYRYFPEPDLTVVQISPKWIAQLQSVLPELPEHKRTRYVDDYGLSNDQAEILVRSKEMSDFFEKVFENQTSLELVNLVVHWLSGEITRFLNDDGGSISNSPLKPHHLNELGQLVQKQVLSHSAAKQVLERIWKTGDSVGLAVQSLGLVQLNDLGALEEVVDRVIAVFPKQVGEYRSGKEKVLGFLVGQAMKETQGKANPTLLGDVFRKKLSS